MSSEAALAQEREQVLSDYNVSRETSRKLDTIVETLLDWSQRLNLVGPKERPRLWSRHIADSLQLCEPLQGARHIVDLGSGAGFPGLVLAAALQDVERVTLVESVGKKCAFLRAAAEAAELPVAVLNERIESVAAFPVDAVTARALAPLPKLLDLSSKWLESGAIGVFPKGQAANEELTAALQSWTFTHQARSSRTDSSGTILILSEVRHRDS